jgi:uncharacterized protein YjbJ (UPF0337 family)
MEGKVPLPFRSTKTYAASEDNTMQSGNQDRVEGSLHELKGKVKEAAGKLVGNPDLTAEGEAEQAAGIVQAKIGDIKKVFEK